MLTVSGKPYGDELPYRRAESVFALGLAASFKIQRALYDNYDLSDEQVEPVYRTFFSTVRGLDYVFEAYELLHHLNDRFYDFMEEHGDLVAIANLKTKIHFWEGGTAGDDRGDSAFEARLSDSLAVLAGATAILARYLQDPQNIVFEEAVLSLPQFDETAVVGRLRELEWKFVP